MAVKSPDNNKPVDLARDGSVKRWSWTGSNKLANNDTTAPIPFTEWADRSVQVLGIFSTGTFVWEGSNDDGVTWATLNDLSGGNAISKTSAGLEGVAEITQFARGKVTGGDGSTSLEVHVVARRANPVGR